MVYKSVVATRRGGPEALRITESELRKPAAGEVRDLLTDGRRAEMILRPVNMSRLERLVVGPRTERQEREAQDYASQLECGAAAAPSSSVSFEYPNLS